MPSPPPRNTTVFSTSSLSGTRNALFRTVRTPPHTPTRRETKPAPYNQAAFDKVPHHGFG